MLQRQSKDVEQMTKIEPVPKVIFEVNEERDKQICSYPYFSKFIKDYDKSIPSGGFVEKFYSEHINDIIASKERLEDRWKVVNDKVMKRLAGVMQIKWPERDAKAIMTINKVCPRFLKEWYFYVSYFHDVELQKGIILHELTHFLYFEKWKQVFPSSKMEEFEKPHLIWELSEILVYPINRDRELIRLVPKTARAYERYYSIKFGGGENIIKHFTSIYERNKADFGNMLKVAYEEIKRLRENFLQK